MEARFHRIEYQYSDSGSIHSLYDELGTALEKFISAVTINDREKVIPLSADVSNYLVMITDRVMRVE